MMTVYFQKRPYIFNKGPYIFRKDRIFSTKDRIFSAEDRIFFVRTVYFPARTVYFPAGPYILQDRIFSRTVYFTFQDRIFYHIIHLAAPSTNLKTLLIKKSTEIIFKRLKSVLTTIIFVRRLPIVRHHHNQSRSREKQAL